MTTLSIDIETYSDNDIKFGVYKYTDTPNFEILIFAYSLNGEEVVEIDLTEKVLPKSIINLILDQSVLKTAYNAQFERVCLSRYLERLGLIEGFLDPVDWRCTMVKAQELGLPASLKQCANYLNLEEQKDTAGTALINYFSKPCKPTKANGMRTRNLPEHAPDKWEAFKAYCGQDVRTEMAIAQELSSYKIHDREWEHYQLDQRMHDRGTGVDLELAQGAMAIDQAIRAEALQKMGAITGLENPNSVSQIKEWLSDRGYEFPSLGKALVEATIQKPGIDPTVKKVLELRLARSNTSTKKYVMMDDATCSDGRIRGLLQFYGATRTGRYSGRLLQVQNLPRNYMSDIDDARELVKSKDMEALELLYDDVPDVLKQLIRTGLIAKDGHTFHVSDFSAIEARVIAWYAEEKKVLDEFNKSGKIYEATAAGMFNLGPIDEYDWTTSEGKAMRQRGKVATLACIAKGQKVLTDKGLVPIEKVTTEHKLWDGLDWVSHDGVIRRGVKEVYTYEGLTATGDHIVWAEVGGEYKQIQFKEAIQGRFNLVHTGSGGKTIRVGENHRPDKSLEKRLEGPKSHDPMHRVWKSKMVQLLQSCKRKIKRLSKLFAEETSTEMARETIYRSKATLHKSQQSRIQKLRGEGYRIQIRECDRGSSLYDKNQRTATVKKIRNRQDRQQRTLRAWKFKMGDQVDAIKKSTETYDILNSGPNNRFTVSNVLVHNCGYQGGVGALKAMGALNMGIPEDELQNLVDLWRGANKKIVNFWYDTQKQVIAALETGRRIRGAKGLKFYKKGEFLFIKLPSGRCISYARPKLEEGKYGQKITYEGKGQKVDFEKEDTYGGKLVENIVQATARDILAEALLRLEANGYDIVFHVHDEAVCEVPIGSRTIEEMNAIMSVVPEWAKGLPLSAEGFETKYYMKD